MVDSSILFAYTDLWLILAFVALWRISLRLAPPIDMDKMEQEYNEVLQNKGRGKLITYVDESLKAQAGSEWSVFESDNTWLPHHEAEAKGVVRPIHPCFELYKQKKYMKNWDIRVRHKSPTSEDFVFLDPEAFPEFENINPGTVTVEGFGIECWAFEEFKPKDLQIYVDHARLPFLPSKQLLRRLDELSGNNPVISSTQVGEELELQDMVGNDYGYPKKDDWVLGLYGLLNCVDVFQDFSDVSSIGSIVLSDSDKVLNIMDFVRQVILAKELATRLQTVESADNYTGFTWRVLSALIVSDLWLKHVGMSVADTYMNLEGIELPDPVMRAKADRFKEEGDKAMSNRRYQDAFDIYGEAMKIDLTSAIYRSGRADSSLAQGNYPEAEEDAHIATLLDPKHLKAWSCLGTALLKQGLSRRAETVYQKALELADANAKPAFAQGVANARSQTQQTIFKINTEPNPQRRHRLRSDFLAQDYDTVRKDIEWHSRVHEQQIDGLLLFAEKMKWPYLDEARPYAKGVYSGLRAGTDINIHLWDWLFGMVFPGKWFALKIMASLVQCSPSLKDTMGPVPNYESGVALPDRTYVRSRTVLARVLGCLPGVVSLCGWVGPLPALVFEEPVNRSKPRYIRVKAQLKPPLMPGPTLGDIKLIGPSVEEVMLMAKKPGETPAVFMRDIKDPARWTSLAPPAQDPCSYKLKEVRVSKLPVPIDTRILDQLDAEAQAQYQAALSFELDKGLSINYRLLTVPIFVTLPPCRPTDLHDDGPGLHEFHKRELPLFKGKIWSVKELKDVMPDGGYGGVIVINATGEGAEVVARAWCSETGRNATIRRPGGPCFVCALRANSSSGLRVGVLIWVG